MTDRLAWLAMVAACGGDAAVGDMTANISAAAMERGLRVEVQLALPGDGFVPDGISATAEIRGQALSLVRHDRRPNGPESAPQTSFEGELATPPLAEGETVEVVVIQAGLPAVSTVTLPEPFDLVEVVPGPPMIVTWSPTNIAPLHVGVTFQGIGNHTCSGGVRPGAFPEPVPDTGRVEIESDLIFMNGIGCNRTVTLRRSREGELAPAFRGGTALGEQARLLEPR